MIKQTTTTRTRSLMLMLVAFILLFPTAIVAQTPNEQQARRFFDQTYNMVFGKQGSSLHYDVNLIGVFKTSGDIWYKDNKSKFVDERYNVWNDGKTYYRVERKKKTVTLYDANSEKKDKYANDFKFSPEDYTYHIADDPKGYLITLKLTRKPVRPSTCASRWLSSGLMSTSASSRAETSATIYLFSRSRPTRITIVSTREGKGRLNSAYYHQE